MQAMRAGLSHYQMSTDQKPPWLIVSKTLDTALPSRELKYPPKMAFEDDFPFSKVGYVNSLEGILFFFSD